VVVKTIICYGESNDRKENGFSYQLVDVKLHKHAEELEEVEDFKTYGNKN
jgi:triosephosphate isomerase